MILHHETAEQAASRLAYSAIQQGYQLQALHHYTDKAGNNLYWRIRLKHPKTHDKWIRPMYFNSGRGYQLGEPKFTQGKPLYNLVQLQQQPEASVLVCEGEWCVDKLQMLGVLATTSGAADSAEAANWQPLAGRNIIIWPDQDNAGRRFATIVWQKLQALGCSVQQIDIDALALPPKGDVVDWLQIHPNATAADIINLAVIKKNTNCENESTAVTTKVNQSALLVNFVLERVTLFHDFNSITYAKDLANHETRRLDGRPFKDWLVANFYGVTGKSPRDPAIREALMTLSGLARFKGACHEVNIRVGLHQEKYYLDLAEQGQSRAVCIDAGNWQIINEPPLQFLRPETIRALPQPIVGGDINLLWDLINIPANTRLLVLAWLIDSLRSDTPFPLLEIIGEQGSAKSTTQTLLRRLIDPNACNLRAAPKATEDIFVSAGVNWLVSYENISHLTPSMQDALCVLSTGGGFAKRKLYTDADESVIAVKRPVILNGISAAITAQDLIDRTVSIETPVITQRAEVTEVLARYEACQGQLLGALLTIFAQAMARLPHIVLPSADRPRLTEFARLGMAVAETMGKSGKDFLAEFNKTRQEAIARTLDASPVATALIEWFDNNHRHTIQLPINQLFAQVEQLKPAHCENWPRSAKGFADALRRAAPALRQLGIICRSMGKIASYVHWEIKAKENDP